MQNAGNRFVEIGRIGRPHGLHGEVRVQPIGNGDVAFEENRILFLRNSRGDMVPSRITALRSDTKSHQFLFFVKFDQIADRSEAERFMDVPVYTEKTSLPPSYYETDEVSYIGYTVYEDKTEIGVVTDESETPAHLILEVQLTNGDLLIPFVDEYILGADTSLRRLRVHNLDQLMEM